MADYLTIYTVLMMGTNMNGNYRKTFEFVATSCMDAIQQAKDAVYSPRDYNYMVMGSRVVVLNPVQAQPTTEDGIRW